MPISQTKYKSKKLSHNNEQPVDLKALYEKAKKKKKEEEK